MEIFLARAIHPVQIWTDQKKSEQQQKESHSLSYQMGAVFLSMYTYVPSSQNKLPDIQSHTSLNLTFPAPPPSIFLCD